MHKENVNNPWMQRRHRPKSVLCLLAFLSFSSLLCAILVGSEPLDRGLLPGAFIEVLSGHSGSLTATLLGLRLERAMTAFLTGGSLALAGVMMQALLRNPLADPYILGVSGGASVGALLVMILGGAAWTGSVAAFAGALGIAFFLFLLARRELGMSASPDAPVQLLLTGVILAFGCGAVVTLLLSIAPDASLRGMVFWLVGDLEGGGSNWLSAAVMAVVFMIVLRSARAINLLAMHTEEAAALGVNVGGTRKLLFTGSALLTACAVTNAGSIGFVGLVVPHFARMLFGADHRLLLPASALTGGIFLVFADLLARMLAAPHQLPVGAVTALIGVPVFLFQLYRVRAG